MKNLVCAFALFAFLLVTSGCAKQEIEMPADNAPPPPTEAPKSIAAPPIPK